MTSSENAALIPADGVASEPIAPSGGVRALPSIPSHGAMRCIFGAFLIPPAGAYLDIAICRAELTAAQRSAAIKRRKEIWEALNLGEKGGNTVPTLGGPQIVGFAASTSAASGMTKRSINEHLARAEALGDDLQAVVGTSLDKGQTWN